MQANDRLLPTRIGIAGAAPIRVAGFLSVFENHPAVLPIVGRLDMLLRELSLGYLLLDLCGDPQWLETLVMVRRVRPDIRQIVIGPTRNDDLILESILAGARGYLDACSGPLAIRQAVECVIEGVIWAPRRVLSASIDRLRMQPVAASLEAQPYSAREHEVLRLILDAYSNREIALSLGIGERTVKAHVTSLLRKSGTDSRLSLSVQTTQHLLGRQSKDVGANRYIDANTRCYSQYRAEP